MYKKLKSYLNKLKEKNLIIVTDRKEKISGKYEKKRLKKCLLTPVLSQKVHCNKME